MTAKISRGGSAKGQGRSRTAARSVSTRRSKPQGMLESAGFAPGTGRRVGGWVFAGMVAAAIIATTVALRLPAMAATAMGETIGEAGFTMKRVEIKGAQRVSRLDIYNVAFDQPSMALPLVDLAATRDRLLQFGWIKEARISRRWPDTLVVDVVERQPVAIWQNNQQLTLIDGEGVVLEPVRLESMPDLPLVIGPAANRQVTALSGLLQATPHLRPQISGATWVGGRRWDIRFQTGETLTLPEGEEASRAILRFARMDQQTQLLGRGFVRFDMRDSRRMIVRVSREPGSTVPDLAAPDPGPVPEDLARTI